MFLSPSVSDKDCTSDAHPYGIFLPPGKIQWCLPDRCHFEWHLSDLHRTSQYPEEWPLFPVLPENAHRNWKSTETGPAWTPASSSADPRIIPSPLHECENSDPRSTHLSYQIRKMLRTWKNAVSRCVPERTCHLVLSPA